MHTPALAVREARLVTYGENGAATVEMLFNQPVDPAAIAKRLIVEAPGGDGAAKPVVTAQGAARAAVVRFAIAGLPQPAFEKDSAAPTDPATSGGALLSAPAGGHVVSHPGVTALLRLPGGTTGAGGPLGLEREWSSALPLGATLALTDAWAQIPAAGDASVHLGLNGAAIPAELLAKLVHVTPALRVKIEAVPGGLVLRGGFTPGETYTVALDAVWPEHGDDPTLALASLPAACTATLAIPQRPRALWLERVDGVGQVTVRGSRVESAALAVYPADAAADAEPLRRSHVDPRSHLRRGARAPQPRRAAPPGRPAHRGVRGAPGRRRRRRRRRQRARPDHQAAPGRGRARARRGRRGPGPLGGRAPARRRGRGPGRGDRAGGAE